MNMFSCMLDFPGGSDGKESAHNVEDIEGFNSWVGKVP